MSQLTKRPLQNVTPHQEKFVRGVVQSIHRRSTRTNDLKLLFLYLRENGVFNQFFEWGSSVAHFRRNQGFIWKHAVSFLATQLYYSKIDRDAVKLSPLPHDVYWMAKTFLEKATDQSLRDTFRHVYPCGFHRDELLASLEFWYRDPKKQKRKGEEDAFHFLIADDDDCPDLPCEDAEFLRNLILTVEDDALSDFSLPLNVIVTDLEQELQFQGFLKFPFSDEESHFLQLHILVLLHNVVFELDSKRFRKLTGHSVDHIQPMGFVSAMEDRLSISVGYFEYDHGNIEPIDLLAPYTVFRTSRLYYPVLMSDLDSDEFVLEGDPNIRQCLYDYPISVQRHGKRHVIVAHERASCRFPKTRSRRIRSNGV